MFRLQEQFFKDVINLVPTGIFWKDVNSVYVGCNKTQAKLCGISEEELIGKTDYDMPWNRLAEQFIAGDRKIMETGLIIQFPPNLMPQAKGDPIWVQTVKMPIYDDDGKVCGVLGCWQDVTEMKNLNEDLQRSNQRLEQFAYAASHDLKAPLRAVSNLATWILNDIKEQKDISLLCELLTNRISRMETLVEGLLEYSRIGRYHTERRAIDLNAIVDNFPLNAYPDHRVDIARDNLPTVCGNEIRLTQIFHNLINNAIKHHHDPSNVRVQVLFLGENDTSYTFCVRDNGPGIDPQFHDKIFEIFQTLKAKDEVEGTGIGLTLVRKIIEDEYKGSICVQSALGKGAAFIFQLGK